MSSYQPGEQGVFPPDYGDADEERRLAYVGLTRGMRRVTISHAGFRRGQGSPSCFLGDIPVGNRCHGWIAGSGPAPDRRARLPAAAARAVAGRQS